MSQNEIYDNPLIVRVCQPDDGPALSPQTKFSTWRRLWVALAQAQQELGLAITDEQIAALRSQVDTIDFAAADAYEKRFRHDVMAHIHALGDAAPIARPIIHLGATSCYVTDNADLILIRAGPRARPRQDRRRDRSAGRLCQKWKELPCLGYTHFQPAQLVTVGKRASLWCHELVLDLEEIEPQTCRPQIPGGKGTTGTQASFLELFGGDDARVVELDRRVAAAFGFARSLSRLRADLFAQGRRPGDCHARRPGRKRAPFRHRPAAPGA